MVDIAVDGAKEITRQTLARRARGGNSGSVMRIFVTIDVKEVPNQTKR